MSASLDRGHVQGRGSPLAEGYVWSIVLKYAIDARGVQVDLKTPSRRQQRWSWSWRGIPSIRRRHHHRRRLHKDRTTQNFRDGEA